MKIQFNTDKTIQWDQRLESHFDALFKEKLDRFGEHITRVEVHISDENGAKEGINDIRCLIEVRLEGRQPFAVSEDADTLEQSVNGALSKTNASLKSILERLKN